MRRVVVPSLMVFATLAAGCGEDQGFSESTVVARIGEAELTAGQLEGLLLQAPEAPTIVQGQAVLSTWLDHAAYAVADARNDDLRAEQVREAAVAPEVLRASILTLAGDTRAARPAPADAQVDSLAALGNVRVFTRLAVPITDPNDSAAVRTAITRLQTLRQTIGTIPPGEFTMAQVPAAQLIGVEQTTTEAVTRGDLPEPIRDGLWRLEPGMVSDIVSGGGAAQLFVRLPTAGGREQLRSWLAERLNRAADQRYVDSLASAANLTIPDDAVARVRALAREPFRAASDAPLGSFDGGEVTVTDLRTWIGLMPAAPRAGILVASDSGIATMLTEAGKRAIMQRIAPAAAPEAIEAVRAGYATRLDSLDAALAAAAPAGEPAVRANTWMGEVFSGRRMLTPLPGALGLVLRDRYEAEVNFEALEWVVQRAADAWAVRQAS